MLVDTGLDPAAVSDPEGHYGKGPIAFFGLEQEASVAKRVDLGPGHQSVRVGKVVLGADVAHYASGLDDHRFPSFGDDLGTQARSAERLRALRDASFTVQPGHDPEVLQPGPIALKGLAEDKARKLL